jgi:hypothetical protein
VATDKKNRSQREDKESKGSVDNGNSSADASASLHARRAKLRGALGSRSAYSSDPFAAAPASLGKSDPAQASQSDPYAVQEDPVAVEPDPSAIQPDPFAVQPDPFAAQSDPYGLQPDQFAVEPDPFAAQSDPFAVQPDPFAVQPDPFAVQPDEYQVQPDPFAVEPDPFGVQAEPFAVEPDPFAQSDSFVNPEYVEGNYGEPPADAYGIPVSPGLHADDAMDGEMRKSRRSRRSSQFEPAAEPPVVSSQTVELVNSIDQSLNVCATNLAALQNLAGEQTEVLKGLAQTLQNQTLLEIGLNLNSLTESLTAALEPMKAIGELVPALDSLVSTLEGKEQSDSEKMSPEQLVTNLADQLSAGLIDAWTFKCAYMAVYPSDNPADLLHRLVELLGSQRLSGDLFRAAYEAVQSAEAPSRVISSSGGGSEIRTVLDENVKVQLDNLEKANRELQKKQEELMGSLAGKENELQGLQNELNQRLEEINSRYADTSAMIASREEEFRAALESKDMDIIEKDAELNMLRAQMEELRVSTEEMGKALHEEMRELKSSQQAAGPAAAAAAGQADQQVNSQGFFDALPRAARPASGLFDTAPAAAKPAFNPADSGGYQDTAYAGDNYGAESGGFAPPQNQGQQSFQAPPAPTFQPPPAPSFQAPPTPTFQPPQPAPAPAPSPSPQQQAVPRQTMAPQATPFAGQSGSYGMGVRQQVFEVIVRQALAGAPWREICAGPMQVNNISPDEVESEVKRRQSLLNK